jgi:hypothetical protein
MAHPKPEFKINSPPRHRFWLLDIALRRQLEEQFKRTRRLTLLPIDGHSLSQREPAPDCVTVRHFRIRPNVLHLPLEGVTSAC